MVIMTQDSTATVELRINARWMEQLETAMQRAGVPAARREGAQAALGAFLLRCRALPGALGEREIRAYVRECAESGAGTRALLDLLEGLCFFFESVLPRPDLAGSAGFPF